MADTETSENSPLLGGEKQQSSSCWNKKVPISSLIVTIIVFCVIIIAACLGVYYGYKNKHQFSDLQPIDAGGVKAPDAGSGKAPAVPPSGPPQLAAGPKPKPQAQTKSKKTWRLPTALEPIEYFISLQPFLISKAQFDPKKTHFFDGNSTLVFLCKEPADNITLHGHNITIHEYWITLNGLNDKLDMFKADTPHTFDSETNQQVFSFNQKCKQGKYYAFHTRYTGYLADDLAGFYKTKYTDQGEKRWLAVTHFESTGARKVAPMFDEPAFKAVWHMTLIYPAEMIALSNMEIRKTDVVPGGWKRSVFYPSLKMSSYLLAFFVGDFAYTESGPAATAKKTKFRTYSRHDFIDQTRWGGSCGPIVLATFEKYYDIEFPLTKMDMVALPEFDAGAMENWGLITYREERILYDKKVYPPSVKRGSGTVVSHELAHQWFGDLVTMDWWADIWLNEGFASFLEYKGAQAVSNYKWDMISRFVESDLQTAMQYDHLPSSHPIYKPVNTPAEISSLFDKISYDKGNVVLSMLNHTIGNDVMVNGLHRYLKTHAYGNANHKDLFDALQIAVNEAGVKGWDGKLFDVNEFMNRWIEQMNYPEVNIKQKGPYTLAITQKRFLIEAETESHPGKWDYEWYTPLWYLNRTTGSAVEMAWIKKNEPLIMTGPAFPAHSWYLMNPKVWGMYRVNYDATNWLQLHDQLRKDHTAIDAPARAQLLDDALVLSVAGTLPYGYALNLTCYLKNEKDYIPWFSAFDNLDYLSRMLSISLDYGAYREFTMSLLETIYPTIAIFDDSVDDDEVTWYDLQEITMAQSCRLGYEPCIEYALKSFNEYKKNCSNSLSSDPTCNHISPNLREVVYCTAVAELGEPAFEFLFQKQFIETINQEMRTMIKGLVCARQPWLLVKLMDSTINGDLVRNQIRFAYGGLHKNPVAGGVVWNFIAENWEWIKQRIGDGGYGVGDLGTLVSGATKNFNKPYHFSIVKNFLTSHPNMDPRYSDAFENALSRIQTNINWMAQHQDKVVSWLRNDKRCSVEKLAP